MSQIDDGGSAFPRPASDSNYSQQDIPLRDWFAGQALTGYLAGRHNSPHDILTNYEARRVACDCYTYADAMLAARKGGDQ